MPSASMPPEHIKSIANRRLCAPPLLLVRVLQLRSFLTEVLIDQLPNLVELQRFLAHLAVTDPGPPKKELILEQVRSLTSVHI